MINNANCVKNNAVGKNLCEILLKKVLNPEH